MRRTIVESPWSAATPEEQARNIRYLRACLLDCYERGEAPVASHAIGTQCLDESPASRQRGIEAGLAWMASADIIAFYVDLGSTMGMDRAAAAADQRGLWTELRRLGDRREMLEHRAAEAAIAQGWMRNA